MSNLPPLPDHNNPTDATEDHLAVIQFDTPHLPAPSDPTPADAHSATSAGDATEDDLALVQVSTSDYLGSSNSDLANSSNPNSTDTPQSGRKRGRETENENKGKIPDTLLHVVVIDVPDGFDILSAIYQYSLAHGTGVSLQSGLGAVTSLKFSHWSERCSKKFKIMSISGVIFPPEKSGGAVQTSPPGEWHLKRAEISLLVVDAAGKMHGGTVDGTCMTTGPVRLVATRFAQWDYFAV